MLNKWLQLQLVISINFHIKVKVYESDNVPWKFVENNHSNNVIKSGNLCPVSASFVSSTHLKIISIAHLYIRLCRPHISNISNKWNINNVLSTLFLIQIILFSGFHSLTGTLRDRQRYEISFSKLCLWCFNDIFSFSVNFVGEILSNIYNNVNQMNLLDAKTLQI